MTVGPSQFLLAPYSCVASSYSKEFQGADLPVKLARATRSCTSWQSCRPGAFGWLAARPGATQQHSKDALSSTATVGPT